MCVYFTDCATQRFASGVMTPRRVPKISVMCGELTCGGRPELPTRWKRWKDKHTSVIVLMFISPHTPFLVSRVTTSVSACLCFLFIYQGMIWGRFIHSNITSSTCGVETSWQNQLRVRTVISHWFSFYRTILVNSLLERFISYTFLCYLRLNSVKIFFKRLNCSIITFWVIVAKNVSFSRIFGFLAALYFPKLTMIEYVLSVMRTFLKNNHVSTVSSFNLFSTDI